MDAERIAEIAARVEAATPGPWFKTSVGAVFRHAPSPFDKSIVAQSDGADADFIAHARQDIPDLLAEVARLSAERDAERSLREEYQVKLAFRSGDLAHARAVIEEARGVCENGPPAWTVDIRRHIAMILDRGLKGAGDE